MKNKFIATLGAAIAVCALTAVPVIAGAAPEKNNAAISGNDTLYTIGSVSKVYVSTAAMQLADKGLIDIDEPVVTYIPEFEMADPRYKDITVRMLMDHSSGLMGTSDLNSFLLADDDNFIHEHFLEALKTQRLKADPGEFSVYCNDGFTLLELLVERVSGMEFTDYVTENIAKPLGCMHTGSYRNRFNDPLQAKIFEGKQPFVADYCNTIGAGGIISTAAETCLFGSSFFDGCNILLSDKSKKEIATARNSDIYEGDYGLGWDSIDSYSGTGVKVLEKNGAIRNQHSILMVAPEQKISVAICMSGQDDSALRLFAKSLMDVALDEQGIKISENEPEFDTVDEIPEKFKAYEGYYYSGGSLITMTLPDMKYVKAEIWDGDNLDIEYYKYTTDGNFVRMLGDVSKGSNVCDPETTLINFVTRPNGKIYITADTTIESPEMGSQTMKFYEAEMLEPNPVSENVMTAWRNRCGKYYLSDKKYSNVNYMNCSSVPIDVVDELDGYVSVMGELMKIKDETHAISFHNIPNSGSRDTHDVEMKMINGVECIVANGGTDVYVSGEDMPDISPDMTDVSFTRRETKWFNIGEDMKGSVLSFDKTENCAVYIYDNNNNTIFSTYMSGFDNKIPLPPSGKIAFIGDSGAKISIRKIQ